MRKLLLLLFLAPCSHAGEPARIGRVEFLASPEAALVRAESDGRLVLLWRLLGALDGGC